MSVGWKGWVVSLKRAKPQTKWQTNQEFLREWLSPLVGWGAYAFILEFREELINKNLKKRRSDLGEQVSWINNMDLA